MSAVKTLNVKGLEHREREQLIFPSIESLKEGQTIRLLFEFNPLPLVHMLGARKGFDTAYAREGPEEWVLTIRRNMPGSDGKEQLKELLYQIALQVLSTEEWDEVKRACDNIGYCCFTPEDQDATEHQH